FVSAGAHRLSSRARPAYRRALRWRVSHAYLSEPPTKFCPYGDIDRAPSSKTQNFVGPGGTTHKIELCAADKLDPPIKTLNFVGPGRTTHKIELCMADKLDPPIKTLNFVGPGNRRADARGHGRHGAGAHTLAGRGRGLHHQPEERRQG